MLLEQIHPLFAKINLYLSKLQDYKSHSFRHSKELQSAMKIPEERWLFIERQFKQILDEKKRERKTAKLQAFLASLKKENITVNEVNIRIKEHELKVDLLGLKEDINFLYAINLHNDKLETSIEFIKKLHKESKLGFHDFIADKLEKLLRSFFSKVSEPDETCPCLWTLHIAMLQYAINNYHELDSSTQKDLTTYALNKSHILVNEQKCLIYSWASLLQLLKLIDNVNSNEGENFCRLATEVQEHVTSNMQLLLNTKLKSQPLQNIDFVEVLDYLHSIHAPPLFRDKKLLRQAITHLRNTYPECIADLDKRFGYSLSLQIVRVMSFFNPKPEQMVNVQEKTFEADQKSTTSQKDVYRLTAS